MTKDSNQSATMKNNNDKEKKMKEFNRSVTMNNNEKEKTMKEFNRSATMKSSNNEKEKMPTRNPLRAISATEFKRKAQQLGKQTYELATLCDIPACLVIQKPDDDDKVYTWPNSMDEVKRVVGVYNATVANDNRPTVQVSKPDERWKESLTANERRMILVSVVDAKIDELKAKIQAAKAAKDGQRKKDPCDEAGIGGGHGFARFLVDERLKKFTAAQIKDLVSELDSKIESLANKISRPTSPPEASTRRSIELPDLNL